MGNHRLFLSNEMCPLPLMKISTHVVLVAALALSACASTQPPAPVATSEPPIQVPERVNRTPFSDVLVGGSCSGHDCDAPNKYFSWGLKITFDFDQQGRLKISKKQEPSLDLNDDPALDMQCGEKGGLHNQRTAWYPFTAIFVRDGALQSVKDASGTSLRRLPLTEFGNGEMRVIGNTARTVEYSFVPCVGKHRVSAGTRIESYLRPRAKLAIKAKKGKNVTISLPDPTEPWGLLRYQSGAVAPVPLRPTLVTIDMTERRLVVYYQSTFPVNPPLSNIELRAILPNQKPAKGESKKKFQARSMAALKEIRNCPVPTKAMEPCATPDRKPDRRIFTN